VLFFHFKKSSNDDPTCKSFIHLQIQNKSIQIDPIVLFKMSQQYDKLLEILTLAGYIYAGPVSENIQL
jgi:hypothetical protein